MIACLDVDYRENSAVAACVLIARWTDESPADEVAVTVSRVEEYEPGQFYKRELPCLEAVLGEIRQPVSCLVVDGYVWLDDEQHPGLGAHLYRAFAESIPVIGVAKTRYQKATLSRELRRGISRTPLFVTAAGIAVDDAVNHIRSMHGPHRIPAMLKRADQLCRCRDSEM